MGGNRRFRSRSLSAVQPENSTSEVSFLAARHFSDESSQTSLQHRSGGLIPDWAISSSSRDVQDASRRVQTLQPATSDGASPSGEPGHSSSGVSWSDQAVAAHRRLHSGGASAGGAAIPASRAGPSMGGGGAVAAAPAQHQHPHRRGAVIAGGADDGPEALPKRPEPLEGHPRYLKVRDLNWGTSGFVQLAVDTQTGDQMAIKFINRGRQHVDVNMREISRELLNQRMCALHPNIVQLREVFLTEEFLAVAMEFADGGDLSEYIDSQFSKGVDYMSEDDARWIFQQLIVAVDYCHRLGIANRDIKLDNMLLHGPWPRPVLKLCDFGFSKNEVVQSVSKSTCGTPEYMAPEVLFESKYNGQDADVWSCGVSLYVLLTGVFPFSRPTDEGEGEGGNTRLMRHMFRRIIAGDYWPVPELSPEAQHLIHHIFRPNPAERCTTEDIMAHPWFTRNLDPNLAALNDRLMAAKAAEHRECQRSLNELDRASNRRNPTQPTQTHAQQLEAQAAAHHQAAAAETLDSQQRAEVQAQALRDAQQRSAMQQRTQMQRLLAQRQQQQQHDQQQQQQQHQQPQPQQQQSPQLQQQQQSDQGGLPSPQGSLPGASQQPLMQSPPRAAEQSANPAQQLQREMTLRDLQMRVADPFPPSSQPPSARAPSPQPFNRFAAANQRR